MKILITYFSNTGNTEKVAKAIKEGFGKENVDLIPVDKVDPDALQAYDLILLGSGIYASRINNSIVNLVKKATSIPSKFAYFCTHASLNFYQKPFIKVSEILEKHDCEIVGEFDCVGDNIGIPEKQKTDMLNRLPPDKRKEAVETQKLIKGRPNSKDLENAKKFAQILIKKI